MSDLNNLMSHDSLRTLVAFSAACSFSVNTNNPLEVVLPLFQPIASALHGKLYDPDVLTDELAGRYDLFVSKELCDHWSKNLIRAKILIPALGNSSSGVYVWSQKNLTNQPPGEFAGDLKNIVLEMRKFINSTNDLLIEVYSDEQLISILRQGVIGSLFPKLHEENRNLGNENQYIFSRFVQYCASQNNKIADSLSKLRRAAIYCDLILHLRTPKKPPKNSQIIFAYLDSPVVMDIIGLGGRKRKLFAERLLRSFNKMLLSPLINRDMIFEIQNNLRALIAKPVAERHGPTADALRAGELRIETITGILDRIETVIENHGIKIDRNFDVALNLPYMDDDAERKLFSNLQSHYSFIEAASRDVRTIRGVFSKRGNLKPDNLFSSKAIFITGNTKLAYISNKFFRDELGYSYSNFPVVITRSVAAALGDAIIGVETSGSMSMADMLIAAADATQYNVEVFEKIERQLRSLRPDDADDLLTILSDIDYSQLAMDAVHGNPKNVTPTTVREITSNIESNLEKKAEDRVKKKLENISREIHALAQEKLKSDAANRSKIDFMKQELSKIHNNSVKIIISDLDKSNRSILHIQKAIRYINYLLALIVIIMVYTSVYYVEYLEKHELIRIAVAFIVGLAAGVPLAIPSVKDRIINKLKDIRNSTAEAGIRTLGYDVIGPLFKDANEIKQELQSQFDLRLDGVSLTSSEETRIKSLLFGEAD
jgi:hypothetical protein